MRKQLAKTSFCMQTTDGDKAVVKERYEIKSFLVAQVAMSLFCVFGSRNVLPTPHTRLACSDKRDKRENKRRRPDKN